MSKKKSKTLKKEDTDTKDDGLIHNNEVKSNNSEVLVLNQMIE